MRQNKLLVIIGIAVLAYLYFFELPEARSAWLSWWWGFSSFIQHPFIGTLRSLSITTVEVVGLLSSILIWLLSIFVTYAMFQITKEKAYLFLIAYFLLPIVVQPTSRMIQKVTSHPEMQEQESRQALQEWKIVRPIQTAEKVVPRQLVVTRRLHFPIGEALLLAGLWFLYRKEQSKCGGLGIPRFSRRSWITATGTLLILLILTCLLPFLSHMRGSKCAVDSMPTFFIKGKTDPLFEYNVQSRGATNSIPAFQRKEAGVQGATQ